MQQHLHIQNLQNICCSLKQKIRKNSMETKLETVPLIGVILNYILDTSKQFGNKNLHTVDKGMRIGNKTSVNK